MLFSSTVKKKDGEGHNSFIFPREKACTLCPLESRYFGLQGLGLPSTILLSSQVGSPSFSVIELQNWFALSLGLQMQVQLHLPSCFFS